MEVCFAFFLTGETGCLALVESGVCQIICAAALSRVGFEKGAPRRLALARLHLRARVRGV